MKEVWKDIPGYGGLYQASSSGRIKSSDRAIKHLGGFRKKKGRVLKQSIGTTGYFHVNLCTINSVKKYWKVHQLVLITFEGNKLSEGLVVNHKDGNKLNNFIENLEWCTPKYNTQHGVQFRSDTRKDITKKILEREYRYNKRSGISIAKEYSCTPQLIYKYLDRYGMPRRTLSNAKKRIYFSEEEKEILLSKKKSIVAMAKEKQCSRSTVTLKMKKWRSSCER